MDHETLARGVLRALRGKRSQAAFSRRLGYATNVAYTWEAGRRFPTAAEMFRAAAVAHVDIAVAITPFFGPSLPDPLRGLDPTSPAFVAALLRELRGSVPMAHLAAAAGLSRSTISRLLAGRIEPRLPVFFRLVEAASRRLLNLLSGLVDLDAIPVARIEWQRLEAARRLAFGNPLSEVVPRFLELESYARLRRHRPGWIAERLGIRREDEERTLRDLEAAGVIRWDRTHWVPDRERSVDTTRGDPRAAALSRGYWTEVANERIRTGGEGQFAYLVFSTDEATLAALRELHLRYYRELRGLVASSPGNERVAVANLQLFAVDVGSAAGPAGGARGLAGSPGPKAARVESKG
jgi:transcriptional regulator with XRE-family HTH domain